MAPAVRSPSTALARCRPVLAGVPVVREEDAAALVADAAQALALRGHAPVITSVNGPRLVRLGALMLDAFGVGRETEDDDG